MKKFAHTETGLALDPQDNLTAADYRARYTPEVTQGWTVAEVPAGTQHGASPQGNGDYKNGDGSIAKADGSVVAAPAAGPAQPNNPGNPYFGKHPLIPKDFWGLTLQVYIAAGGSNGAGLDRLARLTMSPRAIPIVKIIDSVALVDPDDKDGAFLRLLGILTTTNHADGHLLMELAEAAAIMQAWR